MRELVMTGNELVARAAIECGCNFFGGYPITPSSEIAHELSVLLPKNGGKFIQMEDEIAGISVALGAAMSGAKAMTASSGPGISLKAEQIGLGFIAEIPLVIVNVMRGGPSTGLPTRVAQGDILQARNPSHGDMNMIVLAPSNLYECYTQTVRAFNLAARFMTPVILLLDETIGHMQAKVELPEISELEIYKRAEFSGKKSEYKPYAATLDAPAVLNPFFKGYRYHITGLHHGETGFPTEVGETVDYNIKRLFNKINAHTNEIDASESFMLDDADICIIAYGSVALAAKQAILNLRSRGIKVGLFKPITLFPMASKKLKEIGAKFSKILICELNLGQYSGEISKVMLRDDFKTLLKANGRPLSPREIETKIGDCYGI
ncbi:2-oxoglutarate synthase subunit alpha [Campylobacter sp. faydin G-140]|uniref:2-oxoglutarate synthase subunit alpha n=1 Tax=Campylobacter anatolicus TaxID=2829105 RepID=UPI001B9C6E93|nr:2-oxoglutarate synthase subunit alpha [Campylobacter anatolicus]MBR8462887.1 2-oxoglutarate synthase subunit alpha [Campylobacter anatolicus]MBR8465908.1 2-oxoglutarate synthase subunit alpha [Campylobacter anatolicus]